MVTRQEILWLGVASGLSGGLVGGIMLGVGIALVIAGRPVGWLLLLLGTLASGIVGWLLARRLATEVRE